MAAKCLISSLGPKTHVTLVVTNLLAVACFGWGALFDGLLWSVSLRLGMAEGQCDMVFLLVVREG